MATKPKGKPGKKKPAFLFLFFLLLLSSLAYGYTVIHYDDISNYANGVNGTALKAFGWNEFTGCGLNCTTTENAKLHISSGPAISQIYQRFNLKPIDYCISSNGTMSGDPRNFSLRYCFNPQTPYIYTNSDIFRNCIGQSTLSCTGSTYGVDILYINFTSNTINYLTTITPTYRNYINPFDLNQHCVQLNYYVNKTGSNFYNYAVGGYFDGIYNYTSITAPSAFQCLNTSVLRTGNNMYFDDFSVIVYDSGEGFISYSTALIDIPQIYNSMPNYDILQADREGFLTTSVLPGVSPMIYTVASASDPEFNPIYWGLSCGDYNKPVYHENYNDSLSDISVRYQLIANITSIYYATDKTGIVLSDASNYTSQQFYTAFSNNVNAPNNLPDNALYGYAITSDFGIGASKAVKFDLKDYNDNSRFSICVYGNASGLNLTSFSIGCVGVKNTLPNFDISRPFTLRIVINNRDDSISYGFLQRSASGIEYSSYGQSKVNFDYSIPLKALYFYGLQSVTNATVKNTNEFIGQINIDKLEIPDISFYPANFQKNCSSTARLGVYDASVFFTDTSHNGNYAYFSYHPFSVGDAFYTATNPDSVENTFDQLFMGSDFLKYIFALILFLGITFGSFTAGAYLGNAMAGAVVACFAGAVCIIFLTLFGILPAWFAIVVFLILAVVVGFTIKSVFGDGGG